MTHINTVTTLDQLEDSEYLFKVISTILPSLCLDYKVCDKLKTSFVHPFDILINPNLGTPSNINDVQVSIEKLGINYLLDSFSSSKLFNSIIFPGFINSVNVATRSDETKNPIHNTRSFNDLPNFTKYLMIYRLREPEVKARFIGGYVKPESDYFDTLYLNNLYPDLNFENTYLLNLLYKDVITNSIYGFRARQTNGVIFYRDFENLLGVRSLLTNAAINNFDRDFQIQTSANHYNIQLPANNPPQNVDLVTMSIKHFLLYYQYFSTHYDTLDITYNNDLLVNSTPDPISIAASLRFQDNIPELVSLYPDLQVYNTAIILTRDNAGNVVQNNLNIDASFVDISSNRNYFITLLNMLAKKSRSKELKSNLSLFWDGIDYQEYRQKKLSDIIFYNSTCYVMGLYNKNNITYCSMLSDIISFNETPLRVCLLPRVVSGKTVPDIIAETLNSINSISRKDFPKKSASVPMHIGLTENNFMKFFQLLRLVTNTPPERAIKEVLMFYAGLKLNDDGSPHLIKKESYQDFSVLLFSAMGFKVSIKKSIIASNNHTFIIVRPRVTKQYIYNMLVKASCSKDEANKLISASYDLLNFMVSVGDYKNYQNYYFTHNFFPNYFFYGGNDKNYCVENDDIKETIIHLSEPINILDRIDIRGIFSANTTDEILNVDAFSPENIAFKSNLSKLISCGKINGDSIAQSMPLNILDKLITTGGAPCTVSFSELIDNISNDYDDCDSTNEVTELINNAIKDTHSRKNTFLVSQTMNSVASTSQKQLNDMKQSSCQMALIFKNLAKSIYTIEKIFHAKLSDDVKIDILEKFKAFTSLSQSLYKDLISIETLKAILYIVKRSGKTIDDTEIGPEEVRKSYEVIKPKILNMTNYYNEMSRAYFNFMKKNLNISDGNSIGFDNE
ncbi:core protein P4a [Tanapox virus]|uniref:Core protein P4a n=1 Tax=Tanapox virus TaxID=99000 RepID=A7XCN0_9POXV|nr:core protein P4a [Tanapox virus]ABQ43731.1 core protein P4a [Tanapox virus]